MPSIKSNGRPDGPVGIESAAMRSVYREIERVAMWDVIVVLRGERGTGKADCARRLHNASERRHLPFERISLSSLPVDRLASEFFGHVRGAYTGATGPRGGLIVSSAGGTVCLDEVGKAPVETQAYLLEYLDMGSFRPMGSDARRESKVRLVFTANEDLEHLTTVGRMLPDFLDRLGLVHIVVPPLRERREDIVPLLRHFIRRTVATRGSSRDIIEPALAPELIEFVRSYRWPGNVRQLEMAAQALLAFSGGASTLDCSMLPSQLISERRPSMSRAQRQREDARRAWVLLQEHGTMRKAASAFGTSATTFRRLIRTEREGGALEAGS